MAVHGYFRDEIARTWDAVVLAEAWLLFVNLLIQKLLGLLRLHISEHDLVDIPSRRTSLGPSSLAVLLVH